MVARHVPELDGVRGLACLMVVLLHTVIGITPGLSIPYIDGLINALVQGGAGVDLFFVLSGFLIGGILIDNKASENYFSVFWVRRATRILPVYLILLSTYLVALSIKDAISAPWFHDFLMKDPLPLWSYFTFTQNNVMAFAENGGALWMRVTWSLAVEEQFYLLLPLIVFFGSKRAVLLSAAACIVLSPVIRSILWANGGFYTGYMPTPARMDALMMGVVVAYLVRDGQILHIIKRLRLLLDASAVLAISALVLAPVELTLSGVFSLRALMFGYFLLRIYVTSGKMNSLLRLAPLTFAGTVSYSFYMYHQVVNGLMHGWFLGQVPKIENSTGALVAAGVLVVSLTLATVSTFYMENPIREMGRRFKYSTRPETLPASATLSG